MSSEEPLLSGLDLQGHYNSVAGVDHCSVVVSPQGLWDRDRDEGAADTPELPQLLGWTPEISETEHPLHMCRREDALPYKYYFYSNEK